MAASFAQDSRYPPILPVALRSPEGPASHFPPRTSSQHSKQSSSHQLQHHPHYQQELPSSCDLAHPTRNPSVSTVETNRSRAFSIRSNSSQSSVKRKPLPPNISFEATKYSARVSLASSINTVIDPPFNRSYSDDSPILYENPLSVYEQPSYPQDTIPEDAYGEQRLSSRSHGLPFQAHPSQSQSQPDYQVEEGRNSQIYAAEQPHESVRFVRDETPVSAVFARHERLFSDSGLSAASNSTGTNYEDVDPSSSRPQTTSMFSSKPLPPQLELPDSSSYESINSINKALPKSPGPAPGGSKLGSFFGWGGGDRNSLSPVSPSTESALDKGHASKLSTSTTRSSLQKPLPSQTARNVPDEIDTLKANESGYFADAYLQTPGSALPIDEMEDELRAISSELAISIRREMELEDLVERMQSEASQGTNKRNSDYFSDSGTSSTRYGSEADTKAEGFDRLQRKAEREKAQVRLELTDRVNDERSRRKVLESQIRQLEEKASQLESATIDNGRLRDLENTCEDLRRRLNEERQIKENFEDLLTALKSDLYKSHSERDNLRDEIVPQLRARIEGLEAQASEHEKHSYENTKLQQEVQTLKNENNTLVSARTMQMDMQTQMNRFNTSNENDTINSKAPVTMSRSNTVAGRGRTERSMSRPSSLSRSTSVKGSEPRDVLVERVKDIEAQRDALHRALKSLLERQEHQNRAHNARIKQLESERDRSAATSPRRYDREVENLREEINALRRRADEAIEQKWQCEKGLGGLKMDLERAEQEIGSLKKLLVESSPKAVQGLSRSNSVTSHSLERTYADLQAAHARSLEQVKELESKSNTGGTGIRELESSLETVTNDRDSIQLEADALHSSNEALHQNEKTMVESEQALADDLRSSAKRVEDLAIQVRQQLATNASLRERLAETIDRGEKEQKNNAARVLFLQERLKHLEEELILAQQGSEERIATHEEDVRRMKESHSTQLLRVGDGLKSPRVFSPKSPLSPFFSNTDRVPRLSQTTSGPGISISEQSKTAFLKQRVEELEKALEDADKEMEEVVGKMNSAQIEVMELWNEREEAVRVTRKLEQEVAAERKRGLVGRVRTLQS